MPRLSPTSGSAPDSDTLASARQYHRAAIDFFLKSEMDKTMLEGLVTIKGLKSANEFDTMDEFKSRNSADYDAV